MDWVVCKGLYLMNRKFGLKHLVDNKYRSSVKDVKVVPDKEIVSQHWLLLMDMVFEIKFRRKVKLRKKLKLEVEIVRCERRIS